MSPRLTPMAQLRTLDMTSAGRLALLAHAPWQQRVTVQRRTLEDMRPQGRLLPPTRWQHGAARLALAHSVVVGVLTRPLAVQRCSVTQIVFEGVRTLAITGAATALCAPGVGVGAGLVALAHNVARLTGNTHDDAFYCADPTHQRGVQQLMALSLWAQVYGLAPLAAACLLATRLGVILLQPVQVAHTYLTYALVGTLAAAIAVGTLVGACTVDHSLRIARRLTARSAWFLGAPRARAWARTLKRARRPLKNPEQVLAGAQLLRERAMPAAQPVLPAAPPPADAVHMGHMRRYITQCLMRFRHVERYREEAQVELVHEIRDGIVRDLQRGLCAGRWHEAAYRFGMTHLNDFIEITYGEG